MKTLIGMMVLVFLSVPSYAQIDSELTVNVKDTPLKSVLEMIAAKAGLELVLPQDPKINVSLTQSGVSGRQLLEKIASDQQIEYTITSSQLIVTRRGLGAAVGDSHLIHLHYASATEISAKLKMMLTKDERLLVDDRANNLIFVGSNLSYEKVKNLAVLFDVQPKQIMIEALIVETSHSFMRQLGITMSAFGDNTNTMGPTSPNGTFKTSVGIMSGKTLDMQLTAAESKGDAKVVSRPKIITLNNKLAKVQSGITYSIKTLSSVQSGQTGNSQGGGASGNAPGVLTGGISSVDAGLTLSILPSVVMDDEIRLTVDINNSTPDQGSSVDGIPGVLKNSANTTVIVKNRETAVIAGLIKQSKSKTTTGVPFLSDIPLIGLLFKTNAISDQNNELVIFLTPTIGNPENAKTEPALVKGEMKFPSEPPAGGDRAPASAETPKK